MDVGISSTVSVCRLWDNRALRFGTCTRAFADASVECNSACSSSKVATVSRLFSRASSITSIVALEKRRRASSGDLVSLRSSESLPTSNAKGSPSSTAVRQDSSCPRRRLFHISATLGTTLVENVLTAL